MDSTQKILQQVERLSLSQLETFRNFIVTLPYKVEDRPPTREEAVEVRAFLDALLQQASDETEPPPFDADYLP